MDDSLREGIAAAKAGQREHARDLLMRVVEQDEENALAWLWLSGVVDSLDDQEVCLENVLSLEPDNAMAHRGLELLYRQKVEQLMREGTAAAKAGQRERARELLMRAVEYDERNVPAWLWLSDVVDSLDERQVCLENVLSLDPYNAAAQRGLALVQKQQEEQQPPPAPPSESPMVARTRTAATPAAAILREDFANHRPPEPEPEPEPLTPTQDEFSDEYLCPYCATPTAPKERKCPACSGDLWVKFRLREERSPWLWATLTLPIAGTLQSGVLLVLLLVYAYLAHDVSRGSAGGSVDFALRLTGAALQIKSEPFTLLPVYFGLPNQVPSHVASAALEALPRPVFFLFTLPFIFSLMIFIGLYQRWKPVFYLYLVSAALGLILAVGGMILSPMDSLLFAGLSLIALIAAVMLLLGFRIRDDFKWKERRILLRFDRSLANATDFMVRGDFYAQHKMWAMTLIHLRRAAAFLPDDPGCHIALAGAYLRLKRYDRVAQILEKIRTITPDDPRIGELQTLLEDISAGNLVEQADVERPGT